MQSEKFSRVERLIPDCAALHPGYEAGFYGARTDGQSNTNTGHEFNTGKNGVIGRLLTPEERRTLVEFLKTM